MAKKDQGLNAKNVAFDQPGAGLALMGVNERNVWAKYDRLRGVKDEKAGGSEQLWKNLSRWTSTPQGKNLDPQQAKLFNQYIQTGERPDGLTDKTALSAMDWGGREAGRFQQHKPVNFFTEYLMDPLIQAGLTIATGNPYAAMAYGGIKGGVEDGGFGAVKGLVSGYTAGNAGAGLWNAGSAAGGVSGFLSNPGQWASTLGSNAVTGVKNSFGNLLGNGGGGFTNTGALGLRPENIGLNFASAPGGFAATPVAGYGVGTATTAGGLGLTGANLGVGLTNSLGGTAIPGYGNSAVGGTLNTPGLVNAPTAGSTPRSVMGPPKPGASPVDNVVRAGRAGIKIADALTSQPPAGGGGLMMPGAIGSPQQQMVNRTLPMRPFIPYKYFGPNTNPFMARIV